MKLLKQFAAILMIFSAFTLGGFACGGEEENGQDMGQTMEETGDQMGQGAEDMGDQTGETMEETGDEAEDTMQ